MKKLIPFFFILLIFISCEKKQEEINEMNSFLKVNYEFNNRILNQHKEDYYVMIQEQPDKKIEKLDELYLKYELLISDLDKAIVNKENDFEKICTEYNYILNEIPKTVNNIDHLLTEFNPIDNKTDLTEVWLNIIKNNLVIAMAYAFEYADRSKFISNGKFPKYVE